MIATTQRRTTPLLLAALPFVTTACGFFLTQGPPRGHEQLNEFSCTVSNVGPFLDVGWAGLSALTAAFIAADPEYYLGSTARPGIYVGTYLVWSGVSAWSAATGFSKTRRCRAARLELMQRLAGAPQPHRDASMVHTVVISPATDTISVGQQVQLTALARHSSGAPVRDRTFVWSSSNDAIASVNATGLVTAHAPGSVVIAARADQVVGIASLLVRTR